MQLTKAVIKVNKVVTDPYFVKPEAKELIGKTIDINLRTYSVRDTFSAVEVRDNPEFEKYATGKLGLHTTIMTDGMFDIIMTK